MVYRKKIVQLKEKGLVKEKYSPGPEQEAICQQEAIRKSRMELNTWEQEEEEVRSRDVVYSGVPVSAAAP